MSALPPQVHEKLREQSKVIAKEGARLIKDGQVDLVFEISKIEAYCTETLRIVDGQLRALHKTLGEGLTANESIWATTYRLVTDQTIKTRELLRHQVTDEPWLLAMSQMLVRFDELLGKIKDPRHQGVAAMFIASEWRYCTYLMLNSRMSNGEALGVARWKRAMRKFWKLLA